MPHAGFQILLNLAKQMPFGARVFTSNVDGQFQKAGFLQHHVTECHGSIHTLQCFDQCGQKPWSAAEFQPQIDEDNSLLVSSLPSRAC